jgi:acetyl esterase
MMAAVMSRSEPVRSARRRSVAGPGGPLGIEIVVPRGGAAPRPALVWFHGGGFVVGDLTTAGGTARILANRIGAVVVSVDYRLAPEHSLHDAYDDGLAAVAWVARNSDRLGVDPARIAVGGDSAGGNIAAVVALERRHERGYPLALQLLAYAPFDAFGAMHESRAEAHDGVVLNTSMLEWFTAQTALAVDDTSTRHAPLRTGDLSGLPPAILATAGFDPVRDEGLAYHDRLEAAGVPTQLFHYPDQMHGFLSFDAVLGTARRALDELGAATGEALAVPAQDRLFDTAGGGLRAMARQQQRVALASAAFVTESLSATAQAQQRRILRGLGRPLGVYRRAPGSASEGMSASATTSRRRAA